MSAACPLAHSWRDIRRREGGKLPKLSDALRSQLVWRKEEKRQSGGGEEEGEEEEEEEEEEEQEEEAEMGSRASGIQMKREDRGGR